MSVASHLHIRLEEYDSRIRTFIPRYVEMLDAASSALLALDDPSPHILDLGTGTGALAAACLGVRPGATVTAIDEDGDILELARQRLAGMTTAPTLIQGRFDSIRLPACDAVVASLSLHHIRTADAKRQLYVRCRETLPAGGLLVSADCCPASSEGLASLQRARWRDHLRQTYTESETDAFFAAWADEDVYFPLVEELSMMQIAGFACDVAWLAGPMTVIVGRAVVVPAPAR
jgi:tRNA (cmo5U34)-methyltransferase